MERLRHYVAQPLIFDQAISPMAMVTIMKGPCKLGSGPQQRFAQGRDQLGDPINQGWQRSDLGAQPLGQICGVTITLPEKCYEGAP